VADTLKVEINITATDNTAGGVSSAQNRLNALDRSLQKLQKQIDKMSGTKCKVGLEADDTLSSKLADAEDSVQKLNGNTVTVSVDADDPASEILSSAADKLHELDGDAANMEIDADNTASEEISSAGDELAKLDGETATVEIDADSPANAEISETSDRLSALDGNTATTTIKADDSASGVISEAQDRLSALDGDSANIDLEANDAASGPIGEVEDRANALDGKVVTILINAQDSATGAIQNVARMSAAPLAGAAAVMGASFGIYDSIKTFAGFEESMSQVKAISGATGAEMESLTAKAKEMGATTKFTAAESAQAFTYMAMAGWKPAEMMSGLEGIMDLAAASGEGLATTSDIVTDALTAFGMKASDSTHFADVMAQAAANANTNVSMMGESFKYVAPVAGALGYSVEDVGVALGLMANAGIKSSMAGTSLRRAITALASPTDKQAALMDEYGISLTDGEGKMKSLGEVMTDLRTNLGGLDEDLQAAVVSEMFGTEAMSGMLAIINASEGDFEKLTDAINNADGAAKRMAGEMMDNLQGSFTLMQSAIEGVENTLGERLTPYMRTFADTITSLMPDASRVIEDLMNKVDDLAATLSTRLNTLFNSQEFQDADLFGKIDLAWDKIIADPFKEWANTDGVPMIADGLGTLFSKAMKVLPGGEEAGLTDWLAAGVLADGALKAAGGIQTLIGALSALPGPAAAAIGAAGLVAAAVVGISTAIDSYNAIQVQTNLADHFGNLELSMQEAIDLAGKVIPIKEVTAELQDVKVQFHQSDLLRTQAEAEFNKVNNLTWKLASVKLEKDDTLLSSLETEVNGLRTTLIEKMRSDEKGTNDFIKAILGDTPDANEITETISGWFSEDRLQVRSISDAISNILQNALSEGVSQVDTSAAISILQAKMMELANGSQMAELKGKMGWLQATSPLAALSSDSWANYAEAAGSLITEFQSTMFSTYGDYYSTLETLKYNDPGRSKQIEQIQDVVKGAFQDLHNTALLEGWNPLYDSLNTTYGSEITQAREIATSPDYNDLYGNFMSGTGGIDMMNNLVQDIGRTIGSDTQGALLDRFQTMLPTVDALQNAIDSATGPVPEAIKTAYNNAVELGMMAGDTDAMTQYWANQIREGYNGGIDEFKNDPAVNWEGLTEPTQQALERAFKETTSDVDYAGMLQNVFSELGKEDINWDNVADILKEGGVMMTEEMEKSLRNGEVENLDFKMNVKPEIENLDELPDALANAIQDTGSEVTEITPEGIKINLGESEIDGQTAADTIANALGTTVDELELDGTELTVPIDKIDLEANEVDKSQVEETVEQALEGEAGDAGEIEYNGNVNVGADEVNTEELETAAQEAASEVESPEPAEPKVEVKPEPGEIDTSGFYDKVAEQMQEQFNTPIPINISIDPNLGDAEAGGEGAAEGNTDATGIYDQLQTQIQGQFNAPIPIDISIAPNLTGSEGGDGGTEASEGEASGIYDQLQTQLQSQFNSPIPVDISITPNLTGVEEGEGESAGSGEGGSSGIYGQLQDQLQQQFNEPIPVDISIQPSGDGEEGGSENVEEIVTQFREGIQQAIEEEPIEASVTTQATLDDTNAEEIYSEAEQAYRDPFATPIEVTDASVNVTAHLGSHNADAVYQEFAAAAQAAFSTPVTVNATINVNASQGGGGGAANNAEGGFINGPLLSWVGEDGPEFIIPVGSKRHNRGAELWRAAGQALGMFDEMPEFAEGGLVGGDESEYASSPFERNKETAQNALSEALGTDPNNSSQGMLNALPQPIQNSKEQNNNTSNDVSVNVSMNPTIQIDGGGMNDDDIAAAMKSHMRELADDAAYEIGEKLAEVLGNMPMARGA